MTDEFGPFLLDVRERRLLRNGRPVPLRAKVFDTLCVLVQNHGRLIVKEDLIKAVWPDALVEEGNLAHNIAALRKALGSGHSRSDHVETIPGQGYRFTAAVSAVREVAEGQRFLDPRRRPPTGHGTSGWPRREPRSPRRRVTDSMRARPKRPGAGALVVTAVLVLLT